MDKLLYKELDSLYYMISSESVSDFIVAVELVGATTLHNNSWFGLQSLVHS